MRFYNQSLKIRELKCYVCRVTVCFSYFKMFVLKVKLQIVNQIFSQRLYPWQDYEYHVTVNP